MKKSTLTLIAAVLTLPVGLQAQDAQPRITITGTSTVRDWQCRIPTYEMSVQPGSGFAEPILAGTKALEDLRLNIDVKSIECGIDKMDDHLRKALKADEHGTISFDLSLYDLAPRGGGMEATANGTITIAGEARPATLQVQLAADADGRLHARGAYEINMKNHGVEPPKLMLGTLKVGEKVTVEFDVPVEGTNSQVALDAIRR